MRNAIKEYLDFSDGEKKDLWDNATFVFDTNIFLNLYRYTAKTRELLFKAFDSLKDRLWMPNHVAHEFMKNRCKIIIEGSQHYSALNKEVENFISRCCQELYFDGKDKSIVDLEKYMKDWISTSQKENLTVTNPNDDSILEKILALFDGKVGAEYSEFDLSDIVKEGKIRYEQKTPPGYKDKEKQKENDINNMYGDLIVWKQIIQYAKSEKKDIILVTNDQKEDWWQILHGQTIGPRIELRKEFSKETSQRFHMYTMKGFITRFNSGNTDSDTIDEIEFFSRILRHKTSKENLNEYYESLESDDATKAAKIRFKIMRIENKNRKRRNNIVAAKEKYHSGKMPENIEEMMNNNIANIERGNKQIEALRARLQSLG